MASLLASHTVDIADCPTSDVHDNQDPTPSPPCSAYLIADTKVTIFLAFATQTRPQKPDRSNVTTDWQSIDID
jgi:hypothetical protein